MRRPMVPAAHNANTIEMNKKPLRAKDEEEEEQEEEEGEGRVCFWVLEAMAADKGEDEEALEELSCRVRYSFSSVRA